MSAMVELGFTYWHTSQQSWLESHLYETVHCSHVCSELSAPDGRNRDSCQIH